MHDPKSGQWLKQVPLSVADRFEIASCQFAMHYMFQTVNKARNFFVEISSHLNQGGLFIATTIDCAAVVELFSELIYGEVDLSSDSSIGSKRSARLFLSDHHDKADSKTTEEEKSDTNDAVNNSNSEDAFAAIRKFKRLNPFVSSDGTSNLTNDEEERICGAIISNEANNTLLRLSFKVRELRKLFTMSNEEKDWQSAYGIQYSFSLFDEASEGSSSAAVDAPEWIVPIGWPLEHLMEEFDLHLVKRQNFHEAIRERMLDARKLSRFEHIILHDLLRCNLYTM